VGKTIVHGMRARSRFEEGLIDGIRQRYGGMHGPVRFDRQDFAEININLNRHARKKLGSISPRMQVRIGYLTLSAFMLSQPENVASVKISKTSASFSRACGRIADVQLVKMRRGLNARWENCSSYSGTGRSVRSSLESSETVHAKKLIIFSGMS